MDIKSSLQECGLSDKEIAVYVALLPLGTVTVQEVVRKVGFPRTTVYNTLNYLAEKGLVSTIVKSGVNYFTAAAPEELVDRLEEKKKLVESVLPELKELKKAAKAPSRIEIFEGFKGVYSIISDVFRVRQQTYYFGCYKGSLKILKHLPAHARLLRLEKGIPAKIVIDPADEGVFHTEKYRKITEMRFLNSFKEFPAMIFVYGDKVAMYTVKGELVGIIIQNKEFAQAMLMIFDMYWNQSKPAKL